jgi:SAM-dependent methyltransferase
MPTFDEHYARSYDTLYEDKDYDKECDLIVAAGERYGGFAQCRVLDVGSGTGGHALRLAARGYRVTGVEPASAMLARAVAATADLATHSKPTWINADAATFSTPERHEMAILMFAVLGYFGGNESTLRALRNIRQHVVAGGLLVCDFWYGPAVLRVQPTDRIRVKRTGSRELIRAASTQMDSRNHTAAVTFRLWQIDSGRLEFQTEEVHQMRYFFPLELELLLRSSGFELAALSAFPTLDQPVSDETWNAVAVAKAV